MINKIIFFFITFDMFLALAISLAWEAQGVEVHQIELGTQFIAFLKNCSLEFEKVKIEIPSIPRIPLLQNQNVLMVMINVIVNFVNGLSQVINFAVTIINVIIGVLEYCFIVLKNLATMTDFFTAPA